MSLQTFIRRESIRDIVLQRASRRAEGNRLNTDLPVYLQDKTIIGSPAIMDAPDDGFKGKGACSCRGDCVCMVGKKKKLKLKGGAKLNFSKEPSGYKKCAENIRSDEKKYKDYENKIIETTIRLGEKDYSLSTDLDSVERELKSLIENMPEYTKPSLVEKQKKYIQDIYDDIVKKVKDLGSKDNFKLPDVLKTNTITTSMPIELKTWNEISKQFRKRAGSGTPSSISSKDLDTFDETDRLQLTFYWRPEKDLVAVVPQTKIPALRNTIYEWNNSFGDKGRKGAWFSIMEDWRNQIEETGTEEERKILDM